MKHIVAVSVLIALVATVVPTANAVNPPSDTIDIVATSDSFSPNTVTVSTGQKRKLRFIVPSTDTYCCGLEIRSIAFPTLTVAKGGEATTDYLTVTSSFTFSSYWPSTQIHKSDGTVIALDVIAVPVSKPTVTKVEPGRFKRRDSGTFTITVTGTKFASGVKVKVGNVNAKKVTLMTSKKIKAVVPRKSLTVGTHGVTVTNADGGKVTKKRAITIVR